MKNIIIILCLFGFILHSCKNEEKKTQKNAETKTTVENTEGVVDDADPEIDLGGLMNVMGGLMTGNVATDSAGQGLFTPEGQLNVEFLKSEEGKPMRKVFAEIAEVTEEEVDLSLTLMPDNDIVSVKHAEQIEKDLYNPQVAAYEESGKASGNFLELIAESRTTAKERTSHFKKQALKERNNSTRRTPPGLRSMKQQGTPILIIEKTWSNPWGRFFCRFCSGLYCPRQTKGRAPKGTLGPAQGRLLTLQDCATLGIKGILTLYFEDNAITDVNGPDIYVFEIGQIEPTNIEISKNGVDWIDVGKIEGGTAGLDIHDFVQPGDTFQLYNA